jgi:hypothetical protein
MCINGIPLFAMFLAGASVRRIRTGAGRCAGLRQARPGIIDLVRLPRSSAPCRFNSDAAQHPFRRLRLPPDYLEVKTAQQELDEMSAQTVDRKNLQPVTLKLRNAKLNSSK